jgi:hypothetical protein
MFELTCTPEHEWGMPRSQETKYRINLRGKLFNRVTNNEVTCPVWIVLSKDRRALSAAVLPLPRCGTGSAIRPRAPP